MIENPAATDIPLDTYLNSIQSELCTSPKPVDLELDKQVFAACLADIVPRPQSEKTPKHDRS